MLEEKLAGVKNDFLKEFQEREERVNLLKKSNADFVAANQVIKNDNKNLMSLKQTHEKKCASFGNGVGNTKWDNR